MTMPSVLKPELRRPEILVTDKDIFLLYYLHEVKILDVVLQTKQLIISANCPKIQDKVFL
jgi:hypothetical protein